MFEPLLSFAAALAAFFLIREVARTRARLADAEDRLYQLENIAVEIQGDRLLHPERDHESAGNCDWCGDPLGPNDDDLCDRCEWSARRRDGDDDAGSQPVT